MAISHRQGEYFALSCGEYSDYTFNGLYHALRDIDLAFEVDDYIATRKTMALLAGRAIEDDDDDDDFEFSYTLGLSDSGLASHMIQKGAIEEIDYDEIHMGHTFKRSELMAHARVREINLKQQSGA